MRNMAREFAKGFYKSKAWERTREAYAASVGWLCEDCMREGRFTAGKVVHHIVPITPENITDPAITLSWANLRLVCQDCHAMEHKRQLQRRYEILPDGRVVV